MLLSSVNSDYNNDLHSWKEIERQVLNIAKAGFTHTQWIHDWDGEYLYSPSEMFQVRDLLRGCGVKAHTIHASEGGRRTAVVNGRTVFRNGERFEEIRKDYTSANEYTRLAGVDLLKNRVDLCSHIGAGAMVLHMQLPWRWFAEAPQNKTDYFRQVYKSLDELQPYAKAAGVRVALENLIVTPWQLREEQFDRLFDRYDDSFLGFTYDSGHAVLQCCHDYYYFLRKYHSRLYATHLQENCGIDPSLNNDDAETLACDSHWVPMDPRGGGLIDWEEIARWVAKAPLDLPADFEVGIYGDTPEEEFSKLVACRKTAEKFYQMVQAHKKEG